MYGNIPSTHYTTTYINETSFIESPRQQDKSNEEASTTKSSNNDSDSGISSDPTTSDSKYLSEGSTITSVISESTDEIMNVTSQKETSTSQYADVRFRSPYPTVPPTNDVPVQYTVICGHLNTMVI